MEEAIVAHLRHSLLVLCIMSASSSSSYGAAQNAAANNDDQQRPNEMNNPVERRADPIDNDDGDGGRHYPLACELGHFRINADTIIRTQDSRELGAKYVNETELPSKEDCLLWCCQVPGCNVAVFEQKDRGSCYLFDCGPPTDFRCKFTSHHRYTSAILDIASPAEANVRNHQSPNHRNDKDYASGWNFNYPNDEHADALKNLRKQAMQPSGGSDVATTTAPTDDTRQTADHRQDPGMAVARSKPNATQLLPNPTLKSGSSRVPGGPSSNGNTRCTHFQFECRSSGECIAVYNACDGIPQCSDGSDESADLGCPPDGRKFFGGGPISTSGHTQQKDQTVAQPAAAPPGGHDRHSAGGTSQKSDPSNANPAVPNHHNNLVPQQTVSGIRPTKVGHNAQRFQDKVHPPRDSTPTASTSPSAKAKFVNGYEDHYRRPQSQDGTTDAERHRDEMPAGPRMQASARGRYVDDGRPNEPGGHVGGTHDSNGDPDKTSHYNSNGAGNQPDASQNHGHRYESGGRTNAGGNAADPLSYQHKGHEEGRNPNGGGPSVRPAQANSHRDDDRSRQYYDVHSAYDTGHPQETDTMQGANQYGPPARGAYNNMREYYEGAGGYVPSPNADYNPQGNQYQNPVPIGQFAAQEPSYSHHSMDRPATVHAPHPNDDWSAARDSNYDASFSRNRPYSNSDNEQNPHIVYNGNGGLEHSAEARPLDDSEPNIMEPKLTIHVVPDTPSRTNYNPPSSVSNSETANKYWPAQNSNHNPKFDATPQKSGPSVGEILQDFPHHVKQGASDEGVHYNPSGIPNPSKQQPSSILETVPSEGGHLPSPGMVSTSTNYVQKTAPKPIGVSHLQSGTHASDDKMVAKSQSRVEVNLAEVDITRSERSSESSAAILALTLGLSITGLLLVLVGCRLRMIRRRLLRGRSPYAHDADYLVNGMYL